jgi:hypothetical protein
MSQKTRRHLISGSAALIFLASAGEAPAQTDSGPGCRALRSVYDVLTDALNTVVDSGENGGLGNEFWASVVDRDGIVCKVVFSGDDRDAQWPGSRVISAQNANAANAFSLDADDGSGIALSSGNLYGLVQPDGSLFGLQFSNPVDPRVAYGDNRLEGGGDTTRPPAYGTENDPLIGTYIGGINVFGGGLALYEPGGNVIGGLGVSGGTSCTAHVVAWRVRDLIGLDFVPGGVGPDNTDNLIIVPDVTPNTFEHPDCGGDVAQIIADLTTAYPIGD